MIAAIQPLPKWFVAGQLQFNIIREIKRATSRTGYGWRRQQTPSAEQGHFLMSSLPFPTPTDILVGTNSRTYKVGTSFVTICVDISLGFCAYLLVSPLNIFFCEITDD